MSLRWGKPRCGSDWALLIWKPSGGIRDPQGRVSPPACVSDLVSAAFCLGWLVSCPSLSATPRTPSSAPVVAFAWNFVPSKIYACWPCFPANHCSVFSWPKRLTLTILVKWWLQPQCVYSALFPLRWPPSDVWCLYLFYLSLWLSLASPPDHRLMRQERFQFFCLLFLEKSLIDNGGSVTVE